MHHDMKQNAPLYEALEALVTRGATRFHMPGHKGSPLFENFGDIFAIDFTETYGTGNLYDGVGPIRQAEALAAAYYGAADCHFLTGGSTQGVQAMLCAACGIGGTVLLDRTAHKSAVSACALFDLTPHFICPPAAEPFGFGGLLSSAAVEAALMAHPEAAALLVVSPNYYGVSQDIPALAALCRRFGKKLLVDAAHGAHFPALGIPAPIRQGADAAVLSAHKTLPCLGQGAFLLRANSMDGAALREAEAMVGTSSPSYPIMASLDLARAWLEGEGQRRYRAAAALADGLRETLAARTPFRAVTAQDFPSLDPCRLTVCTAVAGVSGSALADDLYETHNIACEMADDRCVVFILTGADAPQDILRLGRALVHEGRRARAGQAVPSVPPLPPAVRAVSVRQAWFAPREDVALGAAEGRICARAVTPYPPGIPLLWPGEKITRAHIEFLGQRWYTENEKISVLADKS